MARFLDAPDDEVRAEAAAALAVSHEPAAVEALRRRWERETDPGARRALLLFLGGSPAVEAAEFLLSLVAKDEPAAADALAALKVSRHWERFKERAEISHQPLKAEG